VHSISALFVGGPGFKYHHKELLSWPIPFDVSFGPSTWILS